MPTPNILIVDDKPENLYTLTKVLQPLKVTVTQAESGARALELILEHEFCLAIVDVQMPEMDGYELVELLRSNLSTAHLPVIFVSAIYSDEYHHRRGYDAGAVDFMSKPFVPEILLSKVKIFLDLYEQRQRLEAMVNQLNTTNAAVSRYAQQLEIGAEVSQQVAAILELDKLLETVVTLIQTRFNYYFVGVWLWDTTHTTILLQAGAGRIQGHSLPKGFQLSKEYARGIINSVCQKGQAYRVNDVSQNVHYIPLKPLPFTRSELTVPLKIGDEILGALDIQNEKHASFDMQDMRVLQALADQIAIAIRNANLYARVVQLNRELELQAQARGEDAAVG
ncbi:MAG TPA: response regulator [Anaerolineae bacterium]|nr:response regulator [Anaerolineae bacterium]